MLASRPLLALVAVVAAPALAADAPGGAPRAAGAPRSPAPALTARDLVPYFAEGRLRAAAEAHATGNFALAAERFAAAVAKLERDAPQRNPARLLHALSLAAAARPREAAPLLVALHADYPLLADHVAYEAARAHLLLGDARAALAWADRVGADAVPRAEAELVALEALERLGRWADLASRAAAFLDRYPAGPRRAEARTRQALALEKQGAPAREVVPLYRMIWRHAPTEPWAARAEERIAAVTETLPEPERTALRTPSPSDWLERGFELGEKQQNAASEAALRLALEGTGEPARADAGAAGLDAAQLCRARYLLAQAVFKQRQRTRAVPLFEDAERACRAAGDGDLLVKSLYQGARCKATAGDRAGAWKNHAAIEGEFPRHSYADDARLRAAELHQDAGDTARARETLAELVARYPEGDQLGEALFRLSFSAYQAGDLDEAARWLEENLTRIPRETVWYAEGRALYWRARVDERRAAAAARAQAPALRASAAAFHERAIREYPLSVYALLAFERLRALDPARRRALLAELRRDVTGAALPVDFGRHELYASPGFRRAVELARAGLGELARRELARLEPLSEFKALETRDQARAAQSAAGKGGGRPPAGAADVPVRERALWLTAVLLDRGRMWMSSHAIPRYTLQDYKRDWPAGAGAAAWRLAYPLAFPELVEEQSRKNAVPVHLQYAIMREESAFNPRIESFANAIGLTQMLVSTAQRFHPETLTRELLFEPATNVAVGSRFLGFLVARYAGALPLAIAGYNAGEAAVDRWLRERGHLPLDEFLETIPYDETRGYTKRVLASFFAYRWLHDARDPVPALSFQLRPAGPNARP